MLKNKINDLSNSAIRKKYFSTEFTPENNLTIRLLRISDVGQNQGGSIAEQDETTDKYAQDEKLQIERTWEVTETASNHELRKHFNEMISFIKSSQKTSRPIKHVLFSFQSRSNRNKKSARELEALVDMGVTLHFARDRRKLTPGSGLSEWMLWLVENMKNESYISELRQNVMGGTIKRIEEGIYPGAKPPYGFISVGRKNSRHFVADGDKAKYMKMAFEMVASGQYALNRVSDKTLKKNLDNIFPGLSKTPNHKKFCELLRNPFYTGEYFEYREERHRSAPGSIESVIDNITFKKVQDVLNNRVRARKLSKSHAYIGLMTCTGHIIEANGTLTDEICGAAVTAEQITKYYRNGNSKKFNYYRCSNQTHKCSQRDKVHMKKSYGRNVSYTQDEIERIFADMFKSFSFDELTCQRLKQFLWDEHFEQKNLSGLRLKELQKRQLQLKQFIDTCYEDKVSKKITEQIWQQHTHKWELEREEIISEIKSLNDQTDEYMNRGVELIELMQHSEIIFKNATPEKKRKLVELTTSNLMLANGRLEYHWKKPFNLLAVNGQKEKWLRWQDSNLRPSD